MDAGQFFLVVAITLVIAVVLAGAMLLWYFDVQNTAPWRIKSQVYRLIEHELKDLGERERLSYSERSVAQVALLHVKRGVDDIKVNW